MKTYPVNDKRCAKSWSSWRLLISLSALSLSLSLLVVPSYARSAKITIKRDGVKIKVPKGQELEVTVKNNNNGKSESGQVDDNGEYTTQDVTGTSNDNYTITVGGETFKGVMGADDQNIKSKEEEKRGSSINLPDFHGSAFAFATTYGIFDRGIDGTPFNQFDLENSSSNAFQVTSLRMYTNLDGKYFRPGSFDSASAISSGTLYRDVTGDLGTFTFEAGGQRLFSADISLATGQYDLLVGTASEIFSDGTLGPSQSFALGSAPVPEPTSLALLGSSLLGAAAFLRKQLPRC